MDYAAIYSVFIADRRAKEPDLLGSYERHHVTPRCLGGSNQQGNIIRLTPSDHLFAHALLARIHGGPLLSTVVRMSGMARYQGRKTRRQYEWARRRLAEMMTGRSAPNRGKSPSAETLRKMSMAARKDWEVSRASRREAMSSPEYRAAISKGLRNSTKNAERKTKIGQSLKQRWTDPEYRKKMSDRMIGKQFALGHKQSEEARRKKSVASKAAWARRKASKAVEHA